MYAPAANSLYRFIVGNEKEIRDLGFWGSGFSKNRLYWSVANLALLHGFNLSEKAEDLPLLSNGSRGYVYGYNRDFSTHKFNGIDCANTVTFSPPMFTIVNYKILNNMLSWEHHWNYHKTIISIMTNMPVTELEQVSELIRSGFVVSDTDGLKINFPVYKVSQFKKMLDILMPIVLEVKETIDKANKTSVKILTSHAPKSLKNKCEPLVLAINSMGTIANIIENMCEQNLLFVPKQNEIVSTYGIVEG